MWPRAGLPSSNWSLQAAGVQWEQLLQSSLQLEALCIGISLGKLPAALWIIHVTQLITFNILTGETCICDLGGRVTSPGQLYMQWRAQTRCVLGRGLQCSDWAQTGDSGDCGQGTGGHRTFRFATLTWLPGQASGHCSLEAIPFLLHFHRYMWPPTGSGWPGPGEIKRFMRELHEGKMPTTTLMKIFSHSISPTFLCTLKPPFVEVKMANQIWLQYSEVCKCTPGALQSGCAEFCHILHTSPCSVRKLWRGAWLARKHI